MAFRMSSSIRNLLAENLTWPFQNLATHRFSLADVPDLSGKTAVVTGGSQGVGYGCTHTLLSRNISKLFILSQHDDVAEEARLAIRVEMGDAAANKVTYLPCDLADWTSIEGIAHNITQEVDEDGVDILINNAAKGIMSADQTSCGVDSHMATNHFGHVLLTSYLLPCLKKASQNDTVRIVTLASNLHEQAKSITFTGLAEINKDYGPQTQYSNSKLASILYARYLARHLSVSHPHILSNAVHPGIVDTKQTNEDIHEPFPLLGYGMSIGAKPFKKSQFEGCISAMYAATVTQKTGEYICSPAVPEAGSGASRDDALQDQLMKMTAVVLREKGIDVPQFY